MQLSAKQPINVYHHYKVSKIVDGDGVFVYNIFDKKEIEVRLLGVDAPELKDCRKLRQDERELHLPGNLLIELGWMSKIFLESILPINSNVSLYTEKNNEIDLFGRTLAYLITSSGVCINEVMLSEGYVKPYDKYYTTQLELYKQLNRDAILLKKGLYSKVSFY